MSTEQVIAEPKVERTGVDTRELRGLNATALLRAIDRTADAQRPTIENVQINHRGTDVAMPAQFLLGHTDISTTMIYTDVLSRSARGVRSPADTL